MSGLFKTTLIKGNRITDFTQTTATVGVVIPKIFGRAPCDGNVIFAPLPPKENRTVKRQGKGGVKQETYTYTMSYAVAFCQGPIYGFWWIKRNGKIVWTNDPAAPIEDAAYAAKWAAKATFYYGTSSQMPDSIIESYKGTGMVSAFRYLAFIVVEDDDLTSQGGAVPSYEAVPIATPPELVLTSHPYAQTFADRARLGMQPIGGLMKVLLRSSDITPSPVDIGLVPYSGAMFVVPPPEMHDDVDLGLLPTGGTLGLPPAGLHKDATSLALAPYSGRLKLPPKGNIFDQTELSFAPTGGTLVEPGYTALLLHFDGADAATATVDSSSYARTMTQVGAAELDTAYSVFGGSSGYIPASTSGWTTPGAAELDMRAGAFQIDWRHRLAANISGSDVDTVIAMIDGSAWDYEWGVLLADTYIRFYMGRRGTNNRSTRFFLPPGYSFGSGAAGTMFALSIGRDLTGKWGAWIDGYRCLDYQLGILGAGESYNARVNGAILTDTTDFGASAGHVLNVGRFHTFAGLSQTKHVDELRMYIGNCRDVTADYTPSATPFT